MIWYKHDAPWLPPANAQRCLTISTRSPWRPTEFVHVPEVLEPPCGIDHGKIHVEIPIWLLSTCNHVDQLDKTHVELGFVRAGCTIGTLQKVADTFHPASISITLELTRGISTKMLTTCPHPIPRTVTEADRWAATSLSAYTLGSEYTYIYLASLQTKLVVRSMPFQVEAVIAALLPELLKLRPQHLFRVYGPEFAPEGVWVDRCWSVNPLLDTRSTDGCGAEVAMLTCIDK